MDWKLDLKMRFLDMQRNFQKIMKIISGKDGKLPSKFIWNLIMDLEK